MHHILNILSRKRMINNVKIYHIDDRFTDRRDKAYYSVQDLVMLYFMQYITNFVLKHSLLFIKITAQFLPILLRRIWIPNR